MPPHEKAIFTHEEQAVGCFHSCVHCDEAKRRDKQKMEELESTIEELQKSSKAAGALVDAWKQRAATLQAERDDALTVARRLQDAHSKTQPEARAIAAMPMQRQLTTDIKRTTSTQKLLQATSLPARRRSMERIPVVQNPTKTCTY